MQSKIESLETRTLFSAATLQAPVQLSVGAGPASIATGDFNGDGLTDLATANTNGTISILLNTGNGTFAAAQTLDAGERPTSIVVGDFSGDTKPDIAVADASSGDVEIFLNEGNGTFGTPNSYVYGTAPGASGAANSLLVTGDFNNDTKTDLAVADENDGKIVVLLGNGNGTFATPINTPFSGVTDIVAGNFSGDGMTDLAVIQSGSDNVDTLLSIGGGAFGTRLTESLPGQPTALAVGDFNGDAHADLAVALTEPARSAIDIAYGSGSGNFSSNSTVIVASPIASLAAGEFLAPSSAAADAATTGLAAISSNGTVTIYQNDGGGTLAAAQTFASATTTTSVTSPVAAVADFSGTGSPSLAYPTSVADPINGAGEIEVVLSQAPSTSSGYLTTLSGALPTSAISGSKTRLSQILTLTNSTSKSIGGKTTVNLYLSTTPAIANGASPALSFTRSLNLAPHASKHFVLALRPIPTVAAGSYYLIASATSTTGASASARSANAVTLGAAFIDLAALSLNVPSTVKAGGRFPARLTIQNNGNAKLNRTVTLSLGISTSASGASPVALAPYSPRLSLSPGRKRTGTLAVRLSSTLAAGSYYLVATVDPNNSLNSPSTTSNTVISNKITVR